MANWDVKTANSALEFDTQLKTEYSAISMIDDNHFIQFWDGGAGGNGYVQVFTISTSTWAITTSNSSLNYATTDGYRPTCAKVDTNHFINFWRGTDADGFVQVFTVNTTNWAVSTANSALEFDTDAYAFGSSYPIDATHFICFWQSTTNNGKAQVFTVSTSTWAVTTSGSVLTFDSYAVENSLAKVDTNHFVLFWTGTDLDGFAQTFTVNTTTWAVTTANTALEYDTTQGRYPSCCQIDTNHFINFWQGTDLDGFAQTFTVNTTTWAITTSSAVLEFDTQSYYTHNCCAKVDTNHFILFWNSFVASDIGKTQTFTVNTSTWAVTTAASVLEFDTSKGMDSFCVKVDTSHFINAWSGADGDGFIQTFEVTLAGAGPANLKTLNTNAFANIKSINTNLIANVKTYNTQT